MNQIWTAWVIWTHYEYAKNACKYEYEYDLNMNMHIGAWQLATGALNLGHVMWDWQMGSQDTQGTWLCIHMYIYIYSNRFSSADSHTLSLSLWLIHIVITGFILLSHHHYRLHQHQRRSHHRDCHCRLARYSCGSRFDGNSRICRNSKPDGGPGGNQNTHSWTIENRSKAIVRNILKALNPRCREQKTRTNII